ncbi:MAG: hypothetical protein Tsb002_26480 [Wenzhouxiangellaceae bacterium]
MKTIFRAAVTMIFMVAGGQAMAASCGNTDVIYNLFDISMDELFENGEGTLGPRRLVTNQTSNIISFGTKRFIQTSFMDINTLNVVIRKMDGSRIGGKTTFVVCKTNSSGGVTKLDEFSIRGGRSNVGTTLNKTYSGLKNHRLSIRLLGNSPTGRARFSMDVKRPGGEGARWIPTQSSHAGPVPGFADVHNHQAADLAFSGGWYWGSHREGSLASRLPRCEGDNHATLQFLGINTGVDLIDPHFDQTFGYPDYDEWPLWSDIKHQQVSAEWLRDAHDRGLNLVVASLVNNQWLAAAAIASGRHNNRMSPSDMEAVKRQIHSLKQMDELNSWYTIVRDPWEARRAIERGEMAVVLAVEVSDVLPDSDGPWLEQLRDLYHMGVRTVQLAHETNSRFSGAAYHRDVFEILSRVKAWFDGDVEFASDGNGVNNNIGLSSEGVQLLAEMIRLNMLIDITHLPIKTQRQIYNIVATQHSYYPLYNSHTRMDALLTAAGRDTLREFVTTDETLEFVRSTGGILGLRTGEDPMLDYGMPASGGYVANNCDGSTRSFAQFYQYADDRGVNLAFGSDFNGFITQIVPRFGPDACANAANATVRAQQRQQQGAQPGNVPDYVDEYYQKGLAHVGLLPAVIDDMQRLGVDTGNLEQSAEAFLQMWERTYDPFRARVP